MGGKRFSWKGVYGKGCVWEGRGRKDGRRTGEALAPQWPASTMTGEGLGDWKGRRLEGGIGPGAGLGLDWAAGRALSAVGGGGVVIGGTVGVEKWEGGNKRERGKGVLPNPQ